MKRTTTAAVVALLVASAAWAADEGDIQGKATSGKKKALKDAPVLVWIKSWPGGQFRGGAKETKTDRKGQFKLSSVIAGGTRYGAYVSIVSAGHTLVSHYHWSSGPGAMPDVELATEPAHPLKLRFVDDKGKPVKDVDAFPDSRVAADGTKHAAATPPRDVAIVRSGKKGSVEMPYFLGGEWVSVDVRFPGGDWETRSFTVPIEKNATVDIAQTVPAMPDLDLTVGDDPKKHYYLLGPKVGDTEPERGYALILMLPGGTGRAGREWVRSCYETWVDSGFVWAQIEAPHWVPEDQNPVWPTKKSRLREAKFTTGEFIDGVIEEVGERYKIDPKRVFTVSWSSSGPACYYLASRKKTPITGSLVAMSVFRRDIVESLKTFKGRPVFILHSPTDTTCPVRMAKDAQKQLTKHGAKVEYAEYEGGHGWAGESEDLARRALRWLWDQTE